MGGHASRFATVSVQPDGKIVGVAGLACGTVSLADWAKRERLVHAGKDPDCPAELPVLPGP
jgi:hypothetical protein